MNALHTLSDAGARCRMAVATGGLMVAFLSIGTVALAADDLATAVASGKAGLDLRYRFDHVEEEAYARDANASTLRTRVNYLTGSWNNSTAFVEMDNVSRLGDDRYFDLRNGKMQYPLIPDPHGTDLNQAWVRYAGIEQVVITTGRQRINFDNQRFIGGSAGRQNEQTFDGLTLEYRGADKLSATASWVTRVNRVVGPRPGNPPAELDSEIGLLNVACAFADAARLTGYYYAMDFDDAPALSNATTGLRLTGELPVGEYRFGYIAEAARQTDHARQPVDYAAGFLNGELKLSSGAHYLAIGHETLEADGAMRFVTPLATLKFHGLAEKFWQTPAGGIEDTTLSVGGTLAGWRLMLKHHWLRQETDAEGDGRHFGQETDFTAFRAFGKHFQLLFVHAFLDVKEGEYGNLAFGPAARFDDTQKTYLALMAKF